MESRHESHQDQEITNGEKYKKGEKDSIDNLSGTPTDLESVNESNNSPQVDVVSTEQEELPPRNSDQEPTGNSACLADYKNEGNLLNDVVTMHTQNCDDDYSPTLAICGIFSKTKSSKEKDTEYLIAKDEEVKDEFLIIDLDTCQTERGSENENSFKGFKVCQSKTQSKSPANGLILVNLSSDDAQTDFLNTSCASSTLSESNSIQAKQDCDSTYDPCFSSAVEKCIFDHKDTTMDQNLIAKPKEEVKLHVPPKVGFNCDIGLQHKGLVLNDLNISHESSVCKETCCSEESFYVSDINDLSLRSNQTEERSPIFYMPEVYTKISDEKDKNSDRLNAVSNPPTCSPAISNDGMCEYYDYANPGVFENLLPMNQFENSGGHDVFESQHSRNAPHYSFDDKSNFKMVQGKKSEFPPVYGLSSSQENKQHLFKGTKSETNVPFRPSFYSTVQDHTPSFFHSPYLPSYCATYPYNFQHGGEGNPQYIPSYSEWNSWSDSTIYEVTLNPYKSVNIDSDHHQPKDHWSSDTNMSDLYQDSHIGIKSNHTDIDSEATEDADEPDGIPMLLDSSTDFSTCDNLSTMSVMSGSCFSDTSSVMAPFSLSEFTPPPSTSTTPIPSGHYSMNTFEDKFGTSFISDNAYSEPLHLYSPTMCSASSYKIKTEDSMQQLLNHGHHQSIPCHYPSMADMHNSRSTMSISSTSSKFEEVSNFTDCRKSHKSQIQSDKISTSTSRNAFDTTRKWNQGACYDVNEPMETFSDFARHEGECGTESRRSRHNEPLKQNAIRIMSKWYEQHLDNPYPTKDDKMKMAQEGGITVTQVKSWFANKRNRTNNTKPKVQKRAMKEKLKKLFQDLKHSRPDSVDNSHIIKQLSGIIQT